MNSLNFRHIWCGAAVLVLASALQAAPVLTVRADKQEALYRSGEPIVFKLKLADDGKALANQTLNYQLSGDVKVNARGTVTTDQAGLAEFKTALDRPGFLKLTANAVLDGKKVQGSGGAGIEPRRITPARPKPQDFDAFWDARKKAIDQFPLRVKLTPVPPKDARLSDRVEVYDLEIAMPEGNPVRGYLALPVKAAVGSLPAQVSFQGAGVHDSGQPLGAALEGKIGIEINAHGILNGQPKSYYEDLNKGALKSYRYDGCTSRETIYFRTMFERVYQAMRYAMSRPEWDGRTLIAVGGSQGGGQALIAAGLVPQVSCLVAYVPALCDHGGITIGRESGWPRFHWNENGRKPEAIAAADYVDAVNFATRINPDADCLLTSAYIDLSCNPASVYACFNTIPAKNKLQHDDVESDHSIPRTTYGIGNDFIRKHVDKMKKGK